MNISLRPRAFQRFMSLNSNYSLTPTFNTLAWNYWWLTGLTLAADVIMRFEGLDY